MRKKLLLGTSIALLIILAVAFFYEFSQGLLIKSRQDAVQILRVSLTNNVAQLKTEVSDSVQKVLLVADAASDLNDFQGLEARRKLREFNDSVHFKKLLLADKNGIAVSGSGVTSNVSESKLYQQALLGSTCLEENDLPGGSGLLIATPIFKDGRIQGVILGEYDSFALSAALNRENFAGEGYAALIKKNGTFLIEPISDKTLVPESTNIYNTLGATKFDKGYSLEMFIAAISLNKEGYVSYSLGDQQRLLYYMPLGINDWYLIKTVTGTFMEQRIVPVHNLIVSLLVKVVIIALLLALIIYGVVHSIHQRQLRESAKYMNLAENVPSGVAEMVVGSACQIQYANTGFYNLIGYVQADFAGEPWHNDLFKIMKPEDVVELRELLTNVQKQSKTVYFDNSIQTQSEQSKWVAGYGKVIDVTRKGTVVQAVFTDVTAEKLKEAALVELSKIDKMTGLYNKVSAQELIEAQLKIPGEGIRILAILDIDSFKDINDNYGHLAGDNAIIALARMLKQHFESRAIIGRIGGDEFVIYLPQDRRKHSTEMQFSQLLLEIKNIHYAIKGKPLSCSLGVVGGTDLPALSYASIFAAADKNLYMAKKAGKGCVKYSLIN